MTCRHGKLDGCAVCEEIAQLLTAINTLRAVRKLQHLIVQSIGNAAPLRTRIGVYLDQLAPHVAQRQAAQLLKEAYEALSREDPKP